MDAVAKKKPGRSEQEFQDLLRRLELALDASQIGVWEHNIRTDEILWDLQMHQLYRTGETRRRISPDIWRLSIHPEDRERAMEEFREAIQAKRLYNSQYRILTPGGEVRYIRSRAHFFEGPDGSPSFIGAEWDVTSDVLVARELAEQKAVAEARAVMLESSHRSIEYAADHDYLTGLPNRRYFDRRFAQLCADPDIGSLAILHLDLDRLKQINDKSGHAAGDAVLRKAAAEISAAFADSALISRIGGDEFAVVLADFGDAGKLGAMAERLIETIQTPVHFGQERLSTGGAVGVAWARREAAASLLAESDIALYEAKKLGRNRVASFTLRFRSELLAERQLAEDLRRAIESGEIEPFYQPQMDARTRRITGFEALARWRHPEGELLAPAAFIRVANQHGLASEIDEAVLRRVLEDRAAWIRQGITPPRIAVNVSPDRLADPQLMEKLAMLDIPPQAIVFELVETIFLDDVDDIVLSNIHQIKRKGIDIEIDDFGSGHASLIGLVKLRPKRLKIDRQLVAAITVSEPQRRLLASIVEIARTLSVEVIAEGVETEKQARLLTRIGCDTLQGFALGMPASQADTFARLQEAALAGDRRAADAKTDR